MDTVTIKINELDDIIGQVLKEYKNSYDDRSSIHRSGAFTGALRALSMVKEHADALAAEKKAHMDEFGSGLADI